MKTIFYSALTAAILLSGCAVASRDGADVPKARAVMEAKSGATLTGNIDFSLGGNGLLYVSVDLNGLAPNTIHGIHLHETGDCSAADASSAGGHLNPGHTSHGARITADEGLHHAGDLGNVTSDDKGKINEVFVAPSLKLDNGDLGVVGKAIVIHAEPDDFKTQPSGNSGKRIGCGVVAMNSSTASSAPEKKH